MAKYRTLISLIALLFGVSFCMAEITAGTLLEAIVQENKYVERVYKENNYKLYSDNLFKINQKDDTVLVTVIKDLMVTGPYRDYYKLYIFSRSDSMLISVRRDEISLKPVSDQEYLRKYDQEEAESMFTLYDNLEEKYDTYYIMYMRGLTRPDFYEKELLLAWDTDSLDILSSYDKYAALVIKEPATAASCYAYRFIIKDGKFTVDSHSYGHPLPPDKHAPDSELQRRRKIREKLKIISLEAYQKLYERKKE